MGGVINFITRRDYQGLDVKLYALGTQDGGAGKQSLTLSGGVGEDEGGSFPPYPQALKITAQARPARAHPGVPVFFLETFVSCASLRASFPVLP